MRRRRQLLPTLATLVGAALLLAGVYGAVAPWLGMAGVVLIFAGGIWALWRTGSDRREAIELQWNPFGGVPPTLGDFSHDHPHHGHHGGLDGGGLFDGGGPFDAGGFFDAGSGGDGGGSGGN